MLKSYAFTCLAVLSSLFCASQASAITLYTYTNGGSSGFWNDANTWTTDPSGVTLTGSAVPGNNDVVHILNGFTVVLNADASTTGLTINIHNGGTLDLATHTFGTIQSLSGAGTLRIRSGYFPTITSNSFLSNFAMGATVEYYDFSGNLPSSVNYPNLTFSNSTATDHVINFSNPSVQNISVGGNLLTRRTGTGNLTVSLGTQGANVINLTIGGNVTIGTGSTFRTSVFNAIHNITMEGSMTNNGHFDMSNASQYNASSTGAARVTFSGASDNSLICNGVTDFYTLTINKGFGSANVLSVTSSDVANLNFYSNGQLITIIAGTLRLGNNINIPRLYGSGNPNYDVGSSTLSPMLWIDGADVNANRSALVVYGKFRITSGSFTSVGGQGTVIREEGQYIIEGGEFTTEKFRPSTTATTHRGSFTMTGGVFNANGTTYSNNEYARFSLPYPEQVFIMSGGTINVSNPEQSTSGSAATGGGIHIGCKASNYIVTGGTINAILSGSASSYKISSTAPFWDLNILKTGGTPTTVLLDGIGSVGGTITSSQPLVILNHFSIEGVNNPILNANNLNVSIGGNFTLNTGATYSPGNNITSFTGGSDQLFIMNGTITGGLHNLTIHKPAGTLTLDGSSPTLTVNNDLALERGILNDGGKSLLVLGDINNTAIHTGTGNIVLNGTATQTISGDGNGIFGNLTLNNPSDPGATATANLTISGTLTLAGTGNSIIDIAHYQLSLTSTSSTALTTTGNDFSSAKMIRTLGLQSDRGIRKTFGNLSPFTFHFGAGTSYTPATIHLTSPPATYGTITARPVGSRHQFVLAGNTNNLTWYWKVVSSGFSGVGPNAVTHMYSYVESSVAPVNDDANYVAARYNPTSWSVINNTATVNEASNIITFPNVGYIDGDFTAGTPSSFGIVRIFYSKRSGNWSDTSPGTTPWSNVSHTGPDASVAPGPGDQVFIGDGSTHHHTITITANNQSAGGLEINTGSTLDVGIYTGHNFGRLENAQISGSGTLRISSASAMAEFPAGDFGNFIRSTGGTVEYYTTGSQDFTIPITSSAPTNLPLISYRNLVLTPGASRRITLPAQDERIFGNLTIQGSSSSAMVHLNSSTPSSLLINGNLLINSGNFQFQNQTAQLITVDGNLTIASGASFNIANTGTPVDNQLVIRGNITNNGVLDFANGSYLCNVTCTGNSNTSITGTGATTDFNVLTVSKGTSQTTVLNVNATAFTLSGSLLPLVLNTGTFRLTSNQTVTIANGSSFNIPSAARLSANGGTLQITGGNNTNLLLAGTLEVLNGAVNVGTTSNDNSIEYASTGQPTITISSGALNIMSQVRRSGASAQGALIYNQSGGVVSVGVSGALTTTRGVFEMLNAGSAFTMSGGSLRILRASGSTSIADLYLHPTSSNVTGGTVEIGTGFSSQTVDINTIIPLYNLTVAGTNNQARLEFNGLTLLGSLSIQDQNVFYANSFNVNIAGNFFNLNTSNGTTLGTGGYQSGSLTQTTTFNSGIGHQTISGVNGNVTNFANLVISNTFTNGVVTLLPSTNLRVNGNLTLASGTLAGGENIITAIRTVSNSSIHTSTTGSITLAGSTNQILSGNGNGRFGNVVLSNGSGATMTANQEITGTLTFTNGSLTIGAYALYISNPSLSAIVGANDNRYIVTSGRLSDAGLIKSFAGSVTNGSFHFPVGIAGKFTPVNYLITTGTSGGNVTIIPVNSKHPSATGSGTAFINYYWSVSHTIGNLVSLTHTYTYSPLDESGNVADYRDARFSGGAWTIGITAGNPNTTTRVITFTNTDLTGDYTTGEPTAFVNPTTYTSVASGSWESDNTVWDIDPPGTNLGPPPGSFVIISDGHTVTVTSNTRRTASLEVRGRLHLGTTTGHDFGTVTASGTGAKTIQIRSSTFPTGNVSNFMAAGGGTVEYNGNITLPTQATYNNLSFTGSGTKTLPNVDLSLNGNLFIAGGTVDNSVNNRNITLLSTTGDFTNNGSYIAGTGALSIGRHLTNSGAGATFVAGNGTSGIRVFGNLYNITSSNFIMGTDSIGVRGNFYNGASFVGNAGTVRISGNVENSGGSFTSGSGPVSISGSLTNGGLFNGGGTTMTIGGSLINSGASATFNGNTSNITVSGDASNNSGATLHGNNSTIQIRGSWNNSATYNANSGTIILNGSAARFINGTTTFNNLTLSGGGSVTTNSNIEVRQLLNLSGGSLATGTNVISLTNTSAQPVTGYGSAGFINGRLSISFPNTAGTSRIFPVGKGSIYRPVTIQQTGASTSPVVRVEMINSAPTGSYPSTIEELSQVRHYAVDLISGTMSSPTVELNFNTNNPADEAITVPGNVRVMRSTSASGPWTDEGGSGVFSPAAPAGYVTSGITSLGNSTYFTLGYQSIPLPITLRHFNAELVNNVVELTWSTYSEKNNAYFTIERSADGLSFDSISFVEGAGDSYSVLHYHKLDHSPLAGTSYYRLKQTDYDGTYTYFDVVFIYNPSNEGIYLKTYPNPAEQNKELWVKLENADNTQTSLLVTDILGRIFYSSYTDLSSPVNVFELNGCKTLERGTYLVKVQSGVYQEVRKVIIR